MISNYITSSSFRCLLGPRSHNLQIYDNLFLWQVGSKHHFAVQGAINDNNINILHEWGPSNFHYLSAANLSILQPHFSLTKHKNISVILDISSLNFAGPHFASIRHALNRARKENFTLEPNYRKIEDVEIMIKEWSQNYTAHYFRDNSGKNLHFYRQNFHTDLLSLFVYKANDLVAFGSLTQPDTDGYSSYVLGKALFKRHYGLSEFADVELYKLGQSKGIRFVNMGAATKGLLSYKTKFTHFTELHYDGAIV